MKNTAALVLSLSLAGGTLVAQDATVRSLLSKDLAGIPERTLDDHSGTYPPGGSDTVHKHHAQVLVYVLEGSIVMQVRGEAPITLVPGQTFYEGPDDVHIVSRNASQTPRPSSWCSSSRTRAPRFSFPRSDLRRVDWAQRLKRKNATWLTAWL